MRVSLLRLGLVTALATGLIYGEASAETVKVSSGAYSEDINYVNPSFQKINELLTQAAIAADIPPEVVKAVAMKESEWKQFENGKPLESNDGGIGIMQITDSDLSEEEKEKLKYNINDNIEKGIEILNSKYDWIAAGKIPGIKGADRYVIENWYFPVMAYNGIKPTNSPVKTEDESENKGAYQYKVFANIEMDSFLDFDPNKSREEQVYDFLGKFPFERAHFQYDRESTENIKFLKTEYNVSNTHDSAYFFENGDWVTVTGAKAVRVRELPNNLDTTKVKFLAPENTHLKITGPFEYDSGTKDNQYVWYPIETKDGKEGYISSAYLKKHNLTDLPKVIPFDDLEEKYIDAVEFLVSKGIQGLTETTFGTQQNIKRVDAAVFVAKAKGLDIDAAPDSGFTDVPPRAKEAVNALKAAGITDGRTTTTFDSEALITRGELAIWLQRAFELEPGNEELAFNDVGDRYENAVSALVNHDITRGTSLTTFGTTSNC